MMKLVPGRRTRGPYSPAIQGATLSGNDVDAILSGRITVSDADDSKAIVWLRPRSPVILVF